MACKVQLPKKFVSRELKVKKFLPKTLEKERESINLEFRKLRTFKL